MNEQPQIDSQGVNQLKDDKLNKTSKASKAKKVVQLFRPKDFRDEHEFLPAALEIQRTPPSPLGRIIIWVIILFFVLAFIWAWFGKIDIVATATGQIVPTGKSKVIQALEPAKVTEILVNNGDKVSKGDVLIKLDSTSVQAEVTQLKKQINELQADLLRTKHVLQLIEQPLNSMMVLPKDLNLSHQLLLQQEVMQYRQQLEEIKDQQARFKADLKSAKASQTKLSKVLPITKKRMQSSHKLLDRSLISEDQFLQIKQNFIEQTQDLKIESLRIESIQAQLKQMQSQQATLRSHTKQTLMQRLLDTQRQKDLAEQDYIKAQQRLKQYVIQSPINGTVQQLAMNTVGGVVTSAQELMVIVPKNQKLEVEAMLLNKDIGFVHEGQNAEVKIDTFNFTKYGVIDAKISNISRDAVENKDLGLVYAMRLKIEKNNVYVDNKLVDLSPGMQVTAEIKTGQRRIIEYLLTPLLRYQNESIRER
ncbi:HlyD family type I secretion periplasmic adaptor subunit [Thiomicrorhabdus hydrogeniphila]